MTVRSMLPSSGELQDLPGVCSWKILLTGIYSLEFGSVQITACTSQQCISPSKKEKPPAKVPSSQV